MAGPLTALVQAYNRRRQWTFDLPHLGARGCVRHSVDVDALGIAPELAEFNLQTKDPTVIGVEYLRDGERQFLPLKSQISGPAGRVMTHQLVRLGVHPLDIIVATWNKDANDFTFRSSVDHLFWTVEDQRRLEGDEERQTSAES